MAKGKKPAKVANRATDKAKVTTVTRVLTFEHTGRGGALRPRWGWRREAA